MQEKALPTSRLVPAFKQVVESEIDTGSAAQVCGSSLREEASLSGQQRGRYTLIRKIGQGGYASIYLGVHHYLNTYVALKLLNRSLTSDEDVKRFQIKSRILAHLRHTLLSSVLCRKASIESCKMQGTSSTPSVQTWSPARGPTSSTGSPKALVIADLDERFIQESSASLCILRWLIGPSVGAGVPVARRETRRCSTFEKLAERPSAIPYVPQEAHKGYRFTRCRWKKSDGERFSQVLNGRFKTKEGQKWPSCR